MSSALAKQIAGVPSGFLVLPNRPGREFVGQRVDRGAQRSCLANASYLESARRAGSIGRRTGHRDIYMPSLEQYERYYVALGRQ